MASYDVASTIHESLLAGHQHHTFESLGFGAGNAIVQVWALTPGAGAGGGASKKRKKGAEPSGDVEASANSEVVLGRYCSLRRRMPFASSCEGSTLRVADVASIICRALLGGVHGAGAGARGRLRVGRQVVPVGAVRC